MGTLIALVSIITLGGEPREITIRYFHTLEECEQRVDLMHSRYPNPGLTCIEYDENS